MFKTSMAVSPSRTEFGPLLFAGDWQRGLNAASALGYDGIEVSIKDPESTAVRALFEALPDSGLSVSTIATGQSYYTEGLSLSDPDQAARGRLMARMQLIIELAAQWKAPVILGGIRGRLGKDESARASRYAAAVEAIGQCAECAAREGVWLAIEPINRYETDFINTVADALEFLDEIGAANVGILADTFHMNIEEVSLGDSLAMAGTRLSGVHLADSNRLAAGQGHIDFPSLARDLRGMGYSGFIIAEILPVPDSYTAAQQAMAFFKGL